MDSPVDITLKKPSVQSFCSNDHREINKHVKFFAFSEEVGSSLPIWLPNGEKVKNLVKLFLRKLEEKHGFIFVNTPILGRESIYRMSGHLNHYREYIFPPIIVNKQRFMLRPMTCPHHCLVFKSQNYSHQNLPVRMSENSILFRYERSGATHGLERVRQMELKDSHIFVPKVIDLIKKEVENCFIMTQTALQKLGIKIDHISLSVHDIAKAEKYFSDPELWRQTEQILSDILTKLKINFKKEVGEAAFYGPKIDFQVKTAMRHDVTLSTIQLDFLLAKKFNLNYRSAKQKKGDAFATPIVIHHGIVGTYERLIALLLEHNNGWLPFWLSPVQVMIFLVHDDEKVKMYFEKIAAFLLKYNFRLKIMNLKKKLAENIKFAWSSKIPVHVFIGFDEARDKTISYSHHLRPKTKVTESVFQFLNQCYKWREDY